MIDSDKCAGEEIFGTSVLTLMYQFCFFHKEMKGTIDFL